jgi:two-component system chemotaxis sensor kinase CheA
MADDLKEFEADFYAECDELLENIKSELAGGEMLSLTSINNLLRFYHTLKGISAMMGFDMIENVSHSAESYLKYLFEAKHELSKKGFSLLFEAVKVIEENLQAKGSLNENLTQRANSIVDELKQELSNISPKTIEAPKTSDNSRPEREATTIKISFISTPEAREKNITVNSIREKISKFGQIISAIPIVTLDKQVKFVFELSTKEAVEEIKESLPEGVEIETFATTPAPPEEKKQSSATISNNAVKLGSGVIRVELNKIEELISQLGDLVISRSQFDEIVRELDGKCDGWLHGKLMEVNQKMERQLRLFRENIMRIRMVPVLSVFDRMQFVAQDAAQTLGKKVRLIKEDNNSEIDKMLVEKITDPLLHLVRNAVSHGIESPLERQKKGKPETGTITLRALNANDKIYIEVADDGEGIDAERLINKAKEKGIIDNSENKSKQTILKIMFTPGFSTRDKADKIGGRGVGMDVVKKALDELGGTIDFETKKGVGTTFTLTLPLTLSILDAILVKNDGQIYAIPQSKAIEVIMVEPETIKNHHRSKLIPYHNSAIKLIKLDELLLGEKKRHGQIKKCVALVIQHGDEMLAIAVDKILGIRELVVRALTDNLVKLPGIKGAAELGNGVPILIISVDELLANPL